MKKREIICTVCLSAVLALAGGTAVCAVEIADEEIQALAAGSAGELSRDTAVTDSASSGSGNAGEILPAPDDGSFIIEEPGSPPEESTQTEEGVPSGEDTQQDGGLTIELIVEEQTVVDDPGMVDSKKIEANVEAMAKEQEDSLIPHLFRSNIVYSVPEVMNSVYSYLRNELGFNHAAACGILGNIQYESGSNPGAVGDGGTSYGLCQWHNGRCKGLIGYCASRDVPFNSVEGQMSYLNYELSGAFQGVRNYLYSVPDTAQGAYDAASYWCRHFEMPLHMKAEAVKRGEFAANVLFWTDFATLTEEDLAAQDMPETSNKLLTEGQVDELQVAYTAALSSAVEEGGAQLIQNVKDCCLFVDDVVQTGKKVYSYFEDRFFVPEETITEGIKSIVAEGYSRYEQLEEQ